MTIDAKSTLDRLLNGEDLTESESGDLATPLTRSGMLVGTPAYMASEQFEGNEADARTDQFNFCVSLWEALAGARPFSSQTLEGLAAEKAVGPPSWPSGAPTIPASVEDLRSSVR